MIEDSEVIYIQNNGTKTPAIVVACELNIGVTIVSKIDKEYLLCVNGPLSKSDYMIGYKQTEQEINCCNGMIQYILDCIETKEPVYATKIDDIVVEYGFLLKFDEPDDSTCAFGA